MPVLPPPARRYRAKLRLIGEIFYLGNSLQVETALLLALGAECQQVGAFDVQRDDNPARGAAIGFSVQDVEFLPVAGRCLQPAAFAAAVCGGSVVCHKITNSLIADDVAGQKPAA